MVQLQAVYADLRAKGIEVVAIGPDSSKAFVDFFAAHGIGFRGIADPERILLDQLGQQVVWWRFGRLPALIAVNRSGDTVWVHSGRSPADLPDLEEGTRRLLNS